MAEIEPSLTELIRAINSLRSAFIAEDEFCAHIKTWGDYHAHGFGDSLGRFSVDVEDTLMCKSS